MPSNVKTENELLPPASGPPDHVNFPNVPIKSERRYDQPMASYPPAPVNGAYASGYNGDLAQQRAQELVAQRMHSQNMPHPQHHGGQIPLQHQQRMMAAQQQQRPPQQMQQRPPQGHIYTSQTDGAGDSLEDWKALVAARAAENDEGRIAADQFMRARVDALAARQDSGLMMPMSQLPKGRKRKVMVRVLAAEDAEKAASSASEQGPARFDGDDEENDSDAINSDLDDPEDDINDGDNSDDETMDYMLCTYDKVQRVKNKWKCTLKDGILTTNKKEYVFVLPLSVSFYLRTIGTSSTRPQANSSGDCSF